MVAQLSIATNGHAPLGKKQKRFNSLVKTANQLRETLRAWRDAAYALHRGAAEHEKQLRKYHANARKLVLLLDGYAADRAFTRIERKQLAAIASENARELLTWVPDAKLKDIYNRHTRGDFDAEAAEAQAAQTRMMQDVLEDHGLQFEERFETLEELEAAARAQQAERDRIAEERRARRKPSATQQRKETEQVQIGKALQEVYRRLVHALHPDREQDPAERARKTALMQDANIAYERRDLLALLELQLRFEQIDGAQIGELAEEKLERFNKLLAEQVAQLREELAAVEHPYRVQLEIYPPRKLSPAHVRASLEEDIATLRDAIHRVATQVRAFADPDEVRAWLRTQRTSAVFDARDFEEMIAMIAGEPPRRRQRG